MAGNRNNYSLISININGLNSPINRHRLSEWIHKQNPAFCCIQETHLTDKDRHYLRVKGWEKNFQANSPKKQAGVAIRKRPNIQGIQGTQKARHQRIK